jgi:hypothetical protein
MHIKSFAMKNIIALFLLAAGLCASFESSGQLLKDAKKLISRKGSGLTEADAAKGIKEALIKGTDESVKVVSLLDGYFLNPEIKIPFPKDAQAIESKLRAVGMGKKVDEVVLSLNRAAEDAANEAKPIFVAAIKGLTISDAVSIVKGPDDAATSYLKKITSTDLSAKFQPVIKASLDKVQATKHWEELITAYNKIPLVNKMNPNLTEYVTQKAMEGLFIMVSKEELKIRKDPVARTSELLKKVFGQ